MIVERPEVLKQWMTETMEPLCDAEPGKLAKYVLALIKKDMPPSQLRESMKNNLDIFLHDQAAPFVDRLFETLENKSYMSKSYIPQASPDSTTQPAAAAQAAAAAAAPVPPESARRRAVEPESAGGGGGRGRGDRRAGSRPRDRDDRVDRPERKRSWEERRRRSPLQRDRRTRRSRSPPRVRTKSRSPPRPKSKSPAKSIKPVARSSRSRSPRSRSQSRSPRYNRSKSPIKFDRSPPAGAEAERAPEPAPAVPDLRQKLNNAATNGKQRCRDYDEKGYCMRGDQCPFDHGLDPVILNDVSMPLPEALKYSQPPPAGLGGAGGAPPATAPPHFNPLVQPPLPRPAIVEPYNPDAPSLTVAAPVPAPVVAPTWQPLPNYARLPPPPHVRPYYPVPTPSDRQLLSVRVQGPPPALAPAGPPGVALRPRHPFTAAERGWTGRDQNEPPRKRGHFDLNRLGGGGPWPRFDHANCSLELRKVPAGLNQITHLNNHFVKFGKITNIQVSFGDDPEAALVTFSNPAEAKTAYKCTEAVLNNRFIKVFWHNKERDEAGGEVVQVSAGGAGQLTRTVTNPEVLRQQAEQQAVAKQQSIDAVNLCQQKLAANVQLQAKHKEKQKEVLKLAADLKKRKTELLDKQLAQQKALFAKLENKALKPEERQKIITTVKALQGAIDKTRAEVLSAVERELPSARAKELAEREMLDAEMDLYQKQQAGVDTSQLQRRVTDLKHQLHSLSRGRGRGRPATIRGGRGRGRGSLSYVPGQQRPTTVDRRPTKLNISGYELDEKSALLAHLAQYGEIVDYQSDDVTPSVVVQFRSRQEAEAAYNKGRQFGDRLLTANWHTQPAPPAAPAPGVAAAAAESGAAQRAAAAAAASADMKSPPGSVVEMDLLADDEDVELESLVAAPADDLLAADEEEEDEHEEERSWRR